MAETTLTWSGAQPVLRGRVALVTGASGGLGAHLTRRFAAAGATVAAHHLSGADAARELVRELGGSAFAVAADLRDERAVARMIDEIAERCGRLDVVVNAAAIQPTASLADVSAQEWRAMLETNVTAPHLVTQAAVRVMRPAGGGAIVHVCSIEAVQPGVEHGHYSVSKAALVMHARAAAQELGPAGIRVNAVLPGLIARPGLETAWPEGVRRWLQATPIAELVDPDSVADACVFLASDLARSITGAALAVDGGSLTRAAF